MATDRKLTPIQSLRRFQAWLGTVGPYFEGFGVLVALVGLAATHAGAFCTAAASLARSLAAKAGPTPDADDAPDSPPPAPAE